MKRKLLLLAGLVLLILGVLFLSGCVAHGNPDVGVPDASGTVYGFWSGLWHGIISPVTFIISLFTDNVNIYAVHNSGNWYDFGFMSGICIIFVGTAGGSSRARKR